MKKIISILAITCLSLSSLLAQDTINASQAKDFMGKDVLLCDRVNYGRYLEVSKKRPVTLFVGPDYPDHYLTLVFTKQALRLFSFDPEKKMVNKRFCVKGKIEKWRGKPAIYIKRESDLNEEE